MPFGEPTQQFTPVNHDGQARGLLQTVPLMLYHKSQPFFQKYESILPTSLIYITLSTLGCSPRRPDADISTTRSDHAARLDFHGPSPEHRIPQRARYSFPRLTLSPHKAIQGFSES
jgi:hypothetical protein